MELKSITFPGMDEPYLTAPGGYGLGTGCTNIGDWNNAVTNGWYKGNVNSPNGWCFGYVTAYTTGDAATIMQTAFFHGNGTGAWKEYKRLCYAGTWNEWKEVSPTAFAPSGTGYEKSPVVLKTSKVTSEEDLNTVLEAVYSSMGSSETRLVRFYGYPSASDYGFFGFLFKSSNNYGSLLVHSAFEKGTLWKKVKFGGTWQDIKKQATSMDLLWTNASPTSAFADQTLTLDLSSYDAVEVEFGYSKDFPNDSQTIRAAIGHSGASVYHANTNNSNGYLLIIARGFTVYENSIGFSAGTWKYSNEKSHSTHNDYVIPTRIYGIKGVG